MLVGLLALSFSSLPVSLLAQSSSLLELDDDEQLADADEQLADADASGGVVANYLKQSIRGCMQKSPAAYLEARSASSGCSHC